MVFLAREIQCQPPPCPCPPSPPLFCPLDRVEEDLKAVFPRGSWAKLHLQFIYFGREHCQARVLCSSVLCTCWLTLLHMFLLFFRDFAVFPLLPPSLWFAAVAASCTSPRADSETMSSCYPFRRLASLL